MGMNRVGPPPGGMGGWGMPRGGQMPMPGAMPFGMMGGGWGGRGMGGSQNAAGSKERESLELAGKYRAAKDDKERADIKKQLEETLNKAFDERQAARDKEITDLEKRVKEMRATAAEQNKKKADAVKSRLDEMTRQRERWGW